MVPLWPPIEVLALDVLVVLTDRSRSSCRRRCSSVLLILAVVLALLLTTLELADGGGAVEGTRGGAFVELACSSIAEAIG